MAPGEPPVVFEVFAYNKKLLVIKISRGLFCEKFEILKGLPVPLFLAVGQKSNFHSPTFIASSSSFWKGMTQPPCPKTQGGNSYRRNGSLWGPSLNHLPKNYLQDLENLVAICLLAHRQTLILNPSTLLEENFKIILVQGG